MIKAGQIYREKALPSWRKNDPELFAIVGDFRPTGGSYATIRPNGEIDYVQKWWIEADCDIVAEYPTWQEAVNSKEFKGE